MFRSLLDRTPEIIEYQVRQTPRGADILIRASGAVDTTALAAAIRAALLGHGLATAVVSITTVDTLSRAASGKFRRFVPLAPAR